MGLNVTCFTKLLVRQYILPLKIDHSWVVLVTGDLSGPSDQSGSFSNHSVVDPENCSKGTQ